MQSIERYGVVALVFLAVTVVAVIMWDSDDPATKTAAAADRKPAAVPAATNPNERGGRVSLRTDNRPNLPLERSQARALPVDPVPEQSRPSTPPAGIRPQGPGAGAGSHPVAQDPPRPVAGPTGGDAGRGGGGVVSPTNEPPTPPGGHAGRDPAPANLPANVYVVKPKETLSEIAMRELGTWRRWEEIVDLNPGLDPNRMRAGIRLVMPKRGTDSPGTAGTSPSPATPAPEGAGQVPSGRTWRVEEGDSLWKIAARALGDGARWGEIATLNPGMNVDRLKLGQVLRLPEEARRQDAAPEDRRVARAEPAAAPRAGRVR